MKCEFCNAQIPEGSIYCLKCGKAVQVVPDFDELEEELLPAMVGDDKKPRSTNKKSSKKNKKGKGNKNNKKKLKTILIVSAIVVISIGFIAGFSYLNSYTYAYQKGVSADKKKDYENAVEFYETALKREKTVECLLAAGKDYFLIENYEKAEEYLVSAFENDSGESKKRTEEIYRALLDLYDQTANYNAIEELMENNKDGDLEELFEEYYVSPPVFSETGGDYDDDIELTLTSNDGYDIYYTTDSTMPSSHNGTLYEGPIEITKGETKINACCVSENDKWGRIVSETYNITYKTPSKPVASPSGGSFFEQVFVELTTKTEDASIYYTWDGSTPTQDSALYEGPIPIPEGNNVLSAVVIDKHDMTSTTLKCNYVYLP